MYIKDTIAAIATPVGEGGIGIIRISGDRARNILSRVFSRSGNGGFTSHRFYYGEIFDPKIGVVVDEGMAVLMVGPKSYTREDVAEIHCHGGHLIVQAVLGIVLREGARLADPGEFTRRAFLNGRIDLVQAQAVMDIISSRTDLSLAVAQRQRQGDLSRSLELLKGRVTHSLAYLEAHIDFPEEDIGEEEMGGVRRNVEEVAAGLTRLLEGFDEGRVLREGISVLIAGKPNVGKSSLLNVLLKEERAIVTHLPGTTRDTIEECISVSGLPVRLIDTAGIRETEDLVEREGVRIALEKVEIADLVLFVVDSSRPLDQDDLNIFGHLQGKKIIVVQSKGDLPLGVNLPEEIAGYDCVTISTRNCTGIEDLRNLIVEIFLHGKAPDAREFVTVTRVREHDILVRAKESLEHFLQQALSGLPPELLVIDLRLALDAFGEVTGETTSDDILDLIFSSFCIGK